MKSGGTVVVSHYGQPNIRDPEASERWHEILQDYVTGVQSVGGIQERAIINIGNGFNTVPFDTEYYERGAQRVYINTGGDVTLIGLPANAPDRSLPSDERIFIEEDQSWMQIADTDYLKRMVKSFLPGLQDNELDKDWAGFEEMCGGKEAKLEILWPVAQLFGTRL